jgi:hypothetical protein
VAKDLYLGLFEVGRNVSLALGKEEYNKYERREVGLLSGRRGGKVAGRL